MRKLAIRASTSKEGEESNSSKPQDGFVKRQWRLLVLAAIMILAFVMRIVFAFGISADNGFALSGGSEASEHIRIIESILNGSFNFVDSSMNYPVGAVSTIAPLLNFILAGFAGIGMLFGASSDVAASGVLALFPPIFAVLACIPVYLIGKKVTKDSNIALVATGFYGFFGVMIMTSVFSNGTAYSFVALLFAFMVYFMLNAFEQADEAKARSISDLWKDKVILKNVMLAGLMFALVALSWSGFHILVIMMVIAMFIQVAIDRLRSKESGLMLSLYSTIILMGVVVSLLYYMPAGLFDIMIIGTLLAAIIGIGLTAFFYFTSSRFAIVMLPVTIAMAIAILAAVNFVSPDLYTSILNGSLIFDNPLVSALSGARHTSISSMASFFGWVTLWTPFAFVGYRIYKFRKNADSRKFTFETIWIALMFAAGWYSAGNAAIISSIGIALTSAIVVVTVFRMVNLRKYFSEMRGNGFKYGLRKVYNPIPLITVIALSVLIVMPSAVTAVNASIPTNDNNDYFTGGYTIPTDDINRTQALWSSYSDEQKAGAIITWLGYSSSAVQAGGFDSVTDSNGGGTSAATAAILAKDGPTATAVMALRIMLAGNINDFSSCFPSNPSTFSAIKNYIDNPSKAVKEVLDNVDKYPGIGSNLTDENAIYLTCSMLMVESMTEMELNDAYDKVCNKADSRISYIMVNSNMIPLYYGDNSYMSSIAFLGNYATDMYGAPTQFYSYDYYSGYAMYTNAFYETFFWKALIGMTPSDAGYSSSSEFLNALALSNGSVKAMPGFGLSGYTIDYWHIMYNPDSTATNTSSGWVDMDAFEAIDLQNKSGGVINYVAGVVVMKHDPTGFQDFSGSVSLQTSSGQEAADGIQIAVFVEAPYDTSGITRFIQKSTTFTRDGKYSVAIPSDGSNYYIRISSGASGMATGSVIATYTDVSSLPQNLVIDQTSLSGSILLNNTLYTEPTYTVIKGTASGIERQENSVNGKFTFNDLMPDKYSLNTYSQNGTLIKSLTVNVVIGANDGLRVVADSGTINVTVTDEYGRDLKNRPSIIVTARNVSTGETFSTNLDNDGKAEIKVVPASYHVSLSNGWVSATASEVSVYNDGTSSSSLVAYQAYEINILGASTNMPISVMSFGYMAVTKFNMDVWVPYSGTGERGGYTFYAVDGDRVFHGFTTGTSVTLSNDLGYKVSGKLTDRNNKDMAGTVAFIADNREYIFSTDSNGSFSVMLPAGSYTLYAYGNDNAMLQNVTISGNSDLGTLKMQESRNVTKTLRFETNMSSPTTRGLVFTEIRLTLDSSESYRTPVVKTNTSGSSIFQIPIGIGGELESDAINNTSFFADKFTYSFAAGSSDNSSSWTISSSEERDEKAYVKTVMVSNGISAKLTMTRDTDITYNIGPSPIAVIPGQYSAKIEGSTGYYFDGTVNVFPGSPVNLSIDATSVATITLNAGDNDVINITAVSKKVGDDDVSGKYYIDSSDPKKYYVEKGFDYMFLATSGSGSGKTIAYAGVVNASSNMSLDLSNKMPVAKISGYVGLVANGTLTVTFGNVTLTFDIKDGAFEMELPSGQAVNMKAQVSKSINSLTYDFLGTLSLSSADVKDGAKYNFQAFNDGYPISAAGLSGSNYSFNNGRGSFTLTIKNENAYDVTYVINPGSSWILDRTYTLTVPANQSRSIGILGSYNPSVVGAGNPNLSVMVTHLDGSSAGTFMLDGTAFGTGTSSETTYVDVRGTEGASSDALNSYEYMYALTITNNDPFQKSVKITANTVGSASDWILVLTTEDGRLIQSGIGQVEFFANGLDKTAIFVKVMYLRDTTQGIPSVNISVVVANAGTNSENVSISGNVATVQLAPKSGELDVQDQTASGDNVSNQSAGAPVLFIVLAIAAILLLILAIWGGMKRGVFTRKR